MVIIWAMHDGVFWKKNAVEAKKLIDDSGLDVHSAVLLQEAADKVKEVLS